jgi:hypothetical protein
VLCCERLDVIPAGIDGSIEGEGHDRHSIGLPLNQVALAQAVFKHCATQSVAVVLINGGQLAIDWLAEHAPAVVEAWYPGVYVTILPHPHYATSPPYRTMLRHHLASGGGCSPGFFIVFPPSLSPNNFAVFVAKELVAFVVLGVLSPSRHGPRGALLADTASLFRIPQFMLAPHRCRHVHIIGSITIRVRLFSLRHPVPAAP